MKIVVGLGNPGVEYMLTRHNAGIVLVDKMSNVQYPMSNNYGWRKHYDALIYKTPDLVLVKSKDVFMNESGRLLQGLPEGELYVAHDDLDLKLGEYKIQFGKGPKEHNGVESVEQALGTRDFWRIRIGIENRTTPVSGEEYVLQKFLSEEKKILDEVLEKICSQLNKS